MKRFKLLILIVMMLLASPGLMAQDEDTTFVLLPDSSNFVTASMIVSSPGEAVYSQLGHVALRMECPRYRLDYCFSFEEEPGIGGIVKFFLGKTHAHMMAVPTDRFLAGFKQEGRRVKQYTLALTNREKQELWRLLDNDYVDEEQRNFNFLENNCSSVSLAAVENVVVDETIDFRWPEPFKMRNGENLKCQTGHWQWLYFWSLCFLGTAADDIGDNDRRIAPEFLVQVIKDASIVAPDGSRRPMVVGEKELLPLVKEYKASPVTPTWAFGTLLFLTILITVAQLKWKLKWLPRVLDVLLLSVVTIVGLLLIYTSFVSGIFGVHWNWYLIPFNPLPLVIWLIWRQRKGFYKIYLLYAAVLALFILATPLSEQLDLPHQLVTATLAVRCIGKYFIH